MRLNRLLEGRVHHQGFLFYFFLEQREGTGKTEGGSQLYDVTPEDLVDQTRVKDLLLGTGSLQFRESTSVSQTITVSTLIFGSVLGV